MITWVTLGINCLILISNAILDIYRKWRDRDKDLKTDNTAVTSTEEKTNVEETTEKKTGVQKK